MTHFMSLPAAASVCFALSLFGATPAKAQAPPPSALAPVTFVSGKGVNSGTCASPASPCRTFQYALGQTSPGGEIKALDPANYFAVSINKSISITGVEGAGIVRGTAGDAIFIDAGTNDVVTLTDLTADGFNKTATNGVKLVSAAKLTIRNCALRNFATHGIAINSTVATKFLIEDTIVANSFGAIHLRPSGTGGSVKGVINRVSLSSNGFGLAIDGVVDATVADSAVTRNSSGIIVGDFPSNGGQLRIAHSKVTENDSVGVRVYTGAAAQGDGDNFIRGNGSSPADDVVGSLTNLGTQ